MMGMIIMMVIWLLSKVPQKINMRFALQTREAFLKENFMTQDQKNKMKSVKKSLENIYEAVKKHVETNDAKILALPDYGLILGTTQLLMEEEIIKGAVAEGKQIMVVQPKQEQKAEEDFNPTPGFLNKKSTTFH